MSIIAKWYTNKLKTEHKQKDMTLIYIYKVRTNLLVN